MCVCTPTIRTPWCGRTLGCQPPKGSGVRPTTPRPSFPAPMSADEMAALPWNAGLNPLLHTPTPGQPSPARDVPRVDPITADVWRLAQFLYELTNTHEKQLGAHQAVDLARAMVRDLDELEAIVADLRGAR